MLKNPVITVNQKLLEKYIRHSVYLEQLKKSEARLISNYLGKEIFPELQKKLINELGRISNLETIGRLPAQRLTKIMLATRKTAQAGMVRAEKMLVNRLVNVSRFEAQWNADLISKTVPIDIDMSMPSNEVLKQLVNTRTMDGAKLGTWIKGYSASVNASMMKGIKVGIATGESLSNIGKRIESVLGYKTKQAEYIARTAVSNVVHQAREEVFKKNTDIVKEVQWISTLDDRTSDICISLDGKIFQVGEGERPPAHFNCRSTVVPVIASWNEFGVEAPPPATRASMDGAVPAKMTYKDWLKDLGKTAEGRVTQNKILGKTKAEWFRKDPSIITKFVDKNLKPLTLKQIAKREGISLEKFLPAPPITKSEIDKLITRGLEIDKIVTVNPKLAYEKGLNTEWMQISKKLEAQGISNNKITIGKVEAFEPTKIVAKNPEISVWKKLTIDERNALNVYMPDGREIVKHQLGLLKDVDYKFVTRADRDWQIAHIESAFKKIEGFNGTTYRGLAFKTEAQKTAFMKDFKVGEIWRSKSFASTSKDLNIAKKFTKIQDMENMVARKGKGVLLHIEGKSGRYITEITKNLTEKEVLFAKGTSFKVNKIVGNKIYLEEVRPTAISEIKAVTTTKVGTTFAKTTEKEIQDVVIKHLDSYPEKVKVALNTKGINYNIGNSLTEINPEIKGLHPTGWSKGATWDSVSGMYNIKNKTISVAETYCPIGQKLYKTISIDKIKMVLNHETGHGFDATVSGNYSNIGKFKSAYAKDVAKLSKIDIAKNDLRFFLQTGENGRSETFADLFGDIMGGGGKPELKKFFPNSAKYIENLLKIK